jgi:hypothetical protein
MALPNPPPRWGNDEITKFLDAARGNQYATFANLSAEFQKLIAIDKTYRKSLQGLVRCVFRATRALKFLGRGKARCERTGTRNLCDTAILS